MVAIRLVCIPHTSVWKIIFNWDIQRKISISYFSWKKKKGMIWEKWALCSFLGTGRWERMCSARSCGFTWPPWIRKVTISFSISGMMLRYQVCIRERMDLSVCILLWETVNSKARDWVTFILVNPRCFTDVNWIERKLFLGRWIWKWHAGCLKEDAECLKS